MATNGNDRTTPLRATIIISTSLQNHDAARMLQAQQHRIRYSDFVESGTFIFPQSGIAFMLVAAQEFPENPEEAGLFERIKTFLQIHRNSFILLLASLHRKKEWEILSTVQQRFFGGNLRILPVHNIAEMVKGMLTIAKATSKPHVVTVRDRMSLARAHVIERSPVWEMLRDIQNYSEQTCGLQSCSPHRSC